MLTKIKTKNILALFIPLIFGLWISSNIKYGGDIDFHAMLLVYEKILETGIYSPSRAYGSLVSELFYGFIAFNIGGHAASFISFFLYYCSLILIFSYFSKSLSNFKILLFFLLLVLSNPYLTLSNTSPSDFSLALFLFSTGLILINKKHYFLSIIPFALCVSARAEYLIFVIIVTTYHLNLIDKNLKIQIKISFFLLFIFLVIILFLPSFISSKFNLAFVLNTGGPDLKVEEILPRFFYKTYLGIGIYNSIFLLLLSFFYFKKVFKLKIKKNILLLILSNFFIFLIIPTKITIISLGLILIYYQLNKLFNLKIFLAILTLNIFSWIYSYQILEISYANNGCSGKKAVAAKLIFNFPHEGIYKSYIIQSKQIVACDAKFFKKNYSNYIDGWKLIK